MKDRIESGYYTNDFSHDSHFQPVWYVEYSSVLLHTNLKEGEGIEYVVEKETMNLVLQMRTENPPSNDTHIDLMRSADQEFLLGRKFVNGDDHQTIASYGLKATVMDAMRVSGIRGFFQRPN